MTARRRGAPPAARGGRPQSGHLRDVASEPDRRAFLDLLADEEAVRLHELGVVRGYPAGSALFVEGQPAQRVFVVLAGHVKLNVAARGREVVLDICGPGELLGEVAGVPGDRYRSAAVALGRVEALDVPSAAFASLAHDSRHLTQLLLRDVAWRLRESERRRVQFATLDTLGRLAALLVELFERFPRSANASIALPLSQEELAGAIGASHKAVTTALRTLRELGWVQTGRRRITLRDAESMRRCA